MSAMKEALYDLCEAHQLDPSHPRSWSICQWLLDREALAYDAPGLELPEVSIAYLAGEPVVIPVEAGERIDRAALRDFADDLQQFAADLHDTLDRLAVA